MLILKRGPDESIIVQTAANETIEIMVTAVRGGRALLGITAPPEVRVDRKEIAQLKAAREGGTK